MRTLALALAALVLVPLVPATPAQSTPALRITEILADPDTLVGQREFVEIWNSGTATVDLAGWKLRDAATTSGTTNTYTFPAWSLAPNARVVVWGGGAPDARGPVWSNSAVWNNAGDAVSVIDTNGEIVDWFGFGTATNAPAGFESRAIPEKAPRGQSLESDGAAWSAHEPTPGTVPGATSGTATLEVQNVAPEAGFGAFPISVKPGQAVQVPLQMTDANGPGDIASWRLSSNNQTLASGLQATAEAAIIAPAAPGPWSLRLEVTDQAGLGHAAMASLTVRWSDLTVVLPADGLKFPAAPPAGEAVLLQGIELRNDGAAAMTPRLDVSPFNGPATFDVVGHLSVGIVADGATTWMAYTGPLMAIGDLAPGESVQLLLRVDNVPALPAGTYGTSFTVIA